MLLQFPDGLESSRMTASMSSSSTAVTALVVLQSSSERKGRASQGFALVLSHQIDDSAESCLTVSASDDITSILPPVHVTGLSTSLPRQS